MPFLANLFSVFRILPSCIEFTPEQRLIKFIQEQCQTLPQVPGTFGSKNIPGSDFWASMCYRHDGRSGLVPSISQNRGRLHMEVVTVSRDSFRLSIYYKVPAVVGMDEQFELCRKGDRQEIMKHAIRQLAPHLIQEARARELTSFS